MLARDSQHNPIGTGRLTPERRPLKPDRTSVAAVKFDRFDNAVDATLRIISEARQNLGIHTPNLEYPLYGHPDVIAAFRQFAIQNRGGYLFRMAADSYTGLWSQCLPDRNRQLVEEFEQRWQRSQPCTEIRVLNV